MEPVQVAFCCIAPGGMFASHGQRAVPSAQQAKEVVVKQQLPDFGGWLGRSPLGIC